MRRKKNYGIDYDVLTVREVGGGAFPVLLLDGKLSETAMAYILKGNIGPSLKTRCRVLKSIGILYDYYKYALPSHAPKSSEQAKRLLDDLYDSLCAGTVIDGRDPTGLYWPPRTLKDVALIVHDLEKFIIYCHDALGLFHFPNEEEGEFTRVFTEAYHRESRNPNSAYSFFAHLRGRDSRNTLGVRRTRHQLAQRRAGVYSDGGGGGGGVKAFPLEYMWDLIIYGTARKGVDLSNNRLPYQERFNVRDQLIMMLLFFGGPRVSEVCNILTQDIYQHPTKRNQLVVRLAHPEAGLTYLGKTDEWVSRREYLWENYRLIPRNLEGGAMQSGWKGMALECNLTKSAFLALAAYPEAQQYLSDIYFIYSQKIRPKFMANAPYRHPYLLVTQKGLPMKCQGFREMWVTSCARAAERREIPLTGKRVDGQNPHSTRHGYVLLLEALGLDAAFRMKAVRHKTPEAQLQYMQKGVIESQEKISNAMENVRQGNTSPDNIAKGDIFIRMDPKQICSGFLFNDEEELCKSLL